MPIQQISNDEWGQFVKSMLDKRHDWLVREIPTLKAPQRLGEILQPIVSKCLGDPDGALVPLPAKQQPERVVPELPLATYQVLLRNEYGR